MASQPPHRDTRNILYQLILDEDIEAFNARCTAAGKLRQFKVNGIDFSGCYFRQADLRGLDLSNCRLEGASIHGAKISGVYFPPELSPQEIRLSLDYGTRLRYGKY